MKRFLNCFSVLLVCLSLVWPVQAVEPLSGDALPVDAPSAILIERSTGTVLYEKNARERLSPASVTKVMTLLLAVEAVDAGTAALTDMVTASARAAGMGGSQIWLEEGEQMSVDEMLKCIAVVSANDCCVALAEHLAGSEEAFVARMNERAAELGMEDTHFSCCSGLREEENYSCARDIAVMSRELLSHPLIRRYTTVWMDSIRDGKFGLNNTNKLIYHYPGATGLKTGFTSKAMYCLSASAERDGVEYIAVVMHAATSAERFESAKTLLNHAFATYTLYSPENLTALPPVAVTLGEADCVSAVLPPDAGVLVERTGAKSLECDVSLPETVPAPVAEGQALGTLTVRQGAQTLAVLPLTAGESVARLSFGRMYLRMLEALVCPKR